MENSMIGEITNDLSDHSDHIKLMIKEGMRIVRGMKEIKSKVEQHQFGCNVAKTTGTSVNAIGVGLTLGGLFFAPLTGGLSLGLTLGGIGTSIAGSITNLGTDLAKSKLIEGLRLETEALVSSWFCLQNDYDEKVRELKFKYGEILREKHSGNLTELIENLKILIYVKYSKYNFDIVKEIFPMAFTFTKEAANASASILNATTTGVRTAGTAAQSVITSAAIVGGNTARIFASQGNGLARGGQVFSQVIKTGAVGANALTLGSLGLGAAVILYDTAWLIKDWKNENEFAKKLKITIYALQLDVYNLQKPSWVSQAAELLKIRYEAEEHIQNFYASLGNKDIFQNLDRTEQEQIKINPYLIIILDWVNYYDGTIFKLIDILNTDIRLGWSDVAEDFKVLIEENEQNH